MDGIAIYTALVFIGGLMAGFWWGVFMQLKLCREAKPNIEQAAAEVGRSMK